MIVSAPADAAAIFDISGPFTAHFELPTSPTNIIPEELGDPTIFGMSGQATVNGTLHPIHFHFYDDAGGGGFDFLLEDTLTLYSPGNGPSVFSGTVFSPTFVAGTYAFTDYYNENLAPYAVTISIVPDVGGVPEPATWAMMILGFGMIGGGLRLRRRTAAPALS